MPPLDILHSGNAEYLEHIAEQLAREAQSPLGPWRNFFEHLDGAPSRWAESASDLVHSYRELGHCLSRLDPLGHRHCQSHPLLELGEFGFSDADLDRQVGPGTFVGPTDGTLRDLVARLQATYCGSIGVEYMEISDKEQRTWLQERMERVLNRPSFSADESRRILQWLITAEVFEKYLHAKFTGQKRFSIEGAEALIPLLHTVIEDGAAQGATEFVLGMAHRGRLNVLAHVVNKPYEIILGEFLGGRDEDQPQGEGDVKYHLGYSCNRATAGGQTVHCSLTANPSHLELVDPVIEGLVRAKQERQGDDEHSRVVPVLIHGEAAFTGQGVVPETLSLSELPGYRTGGTIHVIVNNQVGFTAPPSQTRFTPYPTDVAKMIQAPIFHVNADDPEAVVHAARLAISFRQQFKVDVLIDLVCYRRHGHNETDDPTFTQPLLYRLIDEHKPVAELYAGRLVSESKIESDQPQQMHAEVRKRLEEALAVARELKPRQRITALGGLWTGLGWAGEDWSAKTAVSVEMLRRVTDGTSRLPDGFALHRKLKRPMAARADMAAGKRPVDWGCAEQWAIGSLLLEGTAVRMTGQDAERGTFSHRHAVLHDFERGTQYIPLQHLADGEPAEKQGRFTIINTMLSELGVLGFEYGYSSADPHTLVIWEAQFGDFVNGAQPVIDQFIASGEAKWQRMSGIVLLLPHGYEGQGPEHSSARLERFLQLCGQHNLQVCYPTHPAQYFHLLRRQMHCNFRKPLVVMTPKSLLRSAESTSRLEDFTADGFRPVIDDPAKPPRDQVRRVVLCSGRVFFPLAAAREQRQAEDVAIVRIEQLYPFPRQELRELLRAYEQAAEFAWAQEEPQNMGAWTFIKPRLAELWPGAEWSYAGRPAAASPATGSMRQHQAEERTLIQRALGVTDAAGGGIKSRRSDRALAASATKEANNGQ